MNALIADRYVHEFNRAKPALAGAYLPWLAQAREESLTAFLDIGFPSLHDEDWKYTSVARIEAGRFNLDPTIADHVCDVENIPALALPGARLLVFVNGRFAPELSRIGALPHGVTIASLADTLEREPERLQARLGYPAVAYPSGFTALNAAFVNDGAYVHLESGTTLDEPIQLLYLATAANQAIQPRNVVVAEAGSRVRIVEHHASLCDIPYFNNVVTDIAAGRGAVVEHHKLQVESLQAFHIAAVNAELDTDSHFVSGSFALGGALARADINVGLNAEGAQCALDGLYMADGIQHIDHHTRIDHARPRGSSRELYKGVLAGAARAVFNGKVIVRPDAQQCDAFQTNRNLLLSEQAEVDTKPQLEIWADDVKCGHGATVGQLDPDQLFYLRARGVDDAAAHALLVFAFADEVIERVELAPLRERLHGLLRQRLPAGALQ